MTMHSEIIPAKCCDCSLARYDKDLKCSGTGIYLEKRNDYRLIGCHRIIELSKIKTGEPFEIIIVYDLNSSFKMRVSLFFANGLWSYRYYSVNEMNRDTTLIQSPEQKTGIVCETGEFQVMHDKAVETLIEKMRPLYKKNPIALQMMVTHLQKYVQTKEQPEIF